MDTTILLLVLFYCKTTFTPLVWTSSCQKADKVHWNVVGWALCRLFFLFACSFFSCLVVLVFWLLTWWSRFAFTVVPRTGRLRVQAKSAGYRRKFIAKLLHVIRDHWPRLSTTVSHCIPVVMLQNVTSLFSFGN